MLFGKLGVACYFQIRNPREGLNPAGEKGVMVAEVGMNYQVMEYLSQQNQPV